MNHQEIFEVSNVVTRLYSIAELNKSFIEWLTNHGEPENFPVKVSADQSTLSVAGFGFTAKAVPRAIRLTTGTFAMEFVFLVESENDEIEVSRFYLTDDGRLVDDVTNSESTLTEYKNIYVAKFICVRVLQGILQSQLLVARSVA
jgi:hypothetical protein